ncbi:MAG TPA: DUF72 domain-containing protein, partial [Candidatus Limnocylindrales bacterium]|nr:DUF72 domain-containing protein [Candidatus Limnocylindrales bacterium]
VTPVWRTVDWTYLRFHEGEADPPPCYGDRALAAWARRLAEGWSASDDVYVYFNNDPRACAPENAIRFARAVERVGLEPTRVPEPGSIRVAGS